MEILKIIAVGAVGAVCSILVKRHNGEYAALISVATCIVIILLVIPSLTDAVSSFNDLSAKVGLSDALFKSIVKIVGIGYITEFSASLAEDVKESGIAKNIQFAGKIAIFIMALPILKSVIGNITELLA